jgi:heme exporter protein A
MSERPILETQNLSKAYGFLPVLKKINLQIPHGQFVALLGANGSGKSTFLRLCAGLSKPTTGRLYIGGWEIPREAMAVRAQIGLVSHQSLLYENLTAIENLRFFARLYPIQDGKKRADYLLEQVGLAKRANSLVRTFSRGMQQRLSIARALLNDPQVLLLDEPYTGLDQRAIEVLDELLRQAHQEGRTILMTTHQLERVVQLADRVVILAQGSIGQDIVTDGLDLLQLTTLYAHTTG